MTRDQLQALINRLQHALAAKVEAETEALKARRAQLWSAAHVYFGEAANMIVEYDLESGEHVLYVVKRVVATPSDDRTEVPIDEVRQHVPGAHVGAAVRWRISETDFLAEDEPAAPGSEVPGPI